MSATTTPSAAGARTALRRLAASPGLRGGAPRARLPVARGRAARPPALRARGGRRVAPARTALRRGHPALLGRADRARRAAAARLLPAVRARLRPAGRNRALAVRGWDRGRPARLRLRAGARHDARVRARHAPARLALRPRRGGAHAPLPRAPAPVYR